MLKKIVTSVVAVIVALVINGTLSVDAASSTTTKANVELTSGGPITLDAVPAMYDFNTHDAKQSLQHYDAITGEKSPIQVTNPGNDTGWNVTAEMSKLETASGLQLMGASIDMINNTDYAGDSGVAYLPNGATLNGVTTTKDNASAIDMFPKASSPTLTPGTSATVFSAVQGGGVGVWQTAFKPVLNVPAGNVEGTYTGTITWTLEQTPSGN